MKIPKKIDKSVFIAYLSNKWDKCMFGYIIHEKDITIRIYVKKNKKGDF